MPPTFLRGIPNKENFFDSQGDVTGYVFRPHDKQAAVAGLYDMSINWEDDDKAEEFTLSDRNEETGRLRFRGGAARVARDRIDEMNEEAPWSGAASYESSPIEGVNPYHGSLLLDATRVDSPLSRKAFFSRLQRTIIEVVPPMPDEGTG